MDDLSDLQARVTAAQEKLRLNADDQRKYGLRLNDVVSIVEGSLARQQDEMKRLQDAAVSLQLERDDTRVAETQTKSLYEAALTRLNLLQAQNEQLRNMIMTLLNVVEGRESAGALQSVLQRLEGTVHEIAAAEPLATDPAPEVEAPAGDDAAEAAIDAEEDALEAPSVEAPADAVIAEEAAVDDSVEMATEEATGELTEADDKVEPVALAEATDDADELEMSEAETEEATSEIGAESAEEAMDDDTTAEESAIDAEEETTEVAAVPVAAPVAAEVANTDAETTEDELSEVEANAEDMPEDLGSLSMNSHRDIVTDADEMIAKEADETAETDGDAADEMMEIEEPATARAAAVPQDEILVTALLDAEKALIEAGANGVANVNSPVAEIIRRISLRTREFSEASGV